MLDKSYKNTNNIFFFAELISYSIFMIAFIVLNFYDIPILMANIIYIVFIILLFGYMFLLEFLFKKYDNAVHWKMFEKYYKANKNSPKVKNKRKGLLAVCLCWIVYLSFIYILRLSKILTWQLFLAGGCFMFILNTIFTRKICFLSVFFLKNKNHCCKNCGINSWDYLIFASPLIFAPYLSIYASIINIIIVFISTIMFILWEYNFRKYSYRFYPETNSNLSCSKCLKKCKSQYDLQ